MAPQKDWAVNQIAVGALYTLKSIQQASGKASLADVIVLAGVVGVEQAAKTAGVAIQVPFAPGRVDATQAQTDVSAFELMEPVSGAGRNYGKGGEGVRTEEWLIDRAQLLTLTAPELTVLMGGLRMLGANYDGSQHGVFTNQAGVLSIAKVNSTGLSACRWHIHPIYRRWTPYASAPPDWPGGSVDTTPSSLGLPTVRTTRIVGR